MGAEQITSSNDADFDFGPDVDSNFNAFQDNFFATNGYYKGSAEDIATEAAARQNKARLSNYAKKRRGGVLRYPLEALTEHTDYLQIDIEKYASLGNYISEPGSNQRYVRGNYFGSDRAGRRSSSRLSKKPLVNAGTILLPIPTNIQDSNNVQYDTSVLNGLAATGVKAAEDVMNIQFGQGQNPFEQLSNAVGEAKTSITKGTGTNAAATNAITKFLASKAIGIFGGNVTASQLLARGNGEILNPNMELLFGGPTIRNFRFQFKFTPRNEKEAEQVKLIIRAFKRNMAPQAQGGTLNSGNFFLKTPNVFSLRYRTGRKNHPFLNRFKQCFLSDMQTTYTGESVYSTYDDGTPVSMILDLSFKELQPIYDIDYDSKPGTEAVGY
tara:strand:- start:35 stop:1183 length:1149 start_codon:yes stop_codon:yes gene_type:complete